MKNHQEREFSIYMAFSAYRSKKKITPVYGEVQGEPWSY